MDAQQIIETARLMAKDITRKELEEKRIKEEEEQKRKEEEKIRKEKRDEYRIGSVIAYTGAVIVAAIVVLLIYMALGFGL